MSAIQFGLDLPAIVGDGPSPVDAARAAEDLGFDFLSVNDHMLGPDPRRESWTLLSWLAASTSRIRLATRVLGVPYRHPVLVAKMAETFDRLSNGRLILGLGAGSGDNEFAAMGLSVGSVGHRVDVLGEAIEILRGIWSDTPFSHRGATFDIERAELEPKPAHPVPIWLGTVGPRGLDLVGRQAEGWIPSVAYAPPARAAEMIARIRTSARDAGRDPDKIAYVYNVKVDLDSRGSDDVLGGGSQAVIKQLAAFTKLGFTGFNFVVVGPVRDVQIERLAREVVPEVPP